MGWQTLLTLLVIVGIVAAVAYLVIVGIVAAVAYMLDEHEHELTALDDAERHLRPIGNVDVIERDA